MPVNRGTPEVQGPPAVTAPRVERMPSQEKRREESETSPRKGEKRKRTKRVLSEAASTEEVELALAGTSSTGAGSSRRGAGFSLAEVIDRRLGELVDAINTNTREIQEQTRVMKERWMEESDDDAEGDEE